MQIIPTILTNDRQKAGVKLKKYQDIFAWVQLDIIDGVFSQNRTLLPDEFSKLAELYAFKVDVHLMVDEPVTYLSLCQKINAKRVIGQIEMMMDQEQFVVQSHQLNFQVGLAVDLPTNLEKLDKNLLSQLEVILLMSVKAGFGGQPFALMVLEKIKKLVTIKKEKKLKFKIALDGGLDPKTIKAPYYAGAEIFYIGSLLETDPKGMLKKLKRGVG